MNCRIDQNEQPAADDGGRGAASQCEEQEEEDAQSQRDSLEPAKPVEEGFHVGSRQAGSCQRPAVSRVVLRNFGALLRCSPLFHGENLPSMPAILVENIQRELQWMQGAKHESAQPGSATG